MTIYLISFGYLHGSPPWADRVEDVRQRLRDPAAAKDILDLDGFDPKVQAIVQATPGAAALLDNLVTYVEQCQPTRIAIGCAGGRHRAPSLIELFAKRLEEDYDVDVDHRDVHLPRVLN